MQCSAALVNKQGEVAKFSKCWGSEVTPLHPLFTFRMHTQRRATMRRVLRVKSALLDRLPLKPDENGKFRYLDQLMS